MTKLTVAFRHFAQAPNKRQIHAHSGNKTRDVSSREAEDLHLNRRATGIGFEQNIQFSFVIYFLKHIGNVFIYGLLTMKSNISDY
jgi:hypothetical protein